MSKGAEEALCKSESGLRRLFDSNIIGIIFTDAYGNLTDANQAFLDMIGYTREDLAAGKIRWKDITPPEYLELNRRGITEATERGACTPYEKEYIRKDGSRVPILIGYTSLEKSQTDFICFVLDLTAQKQGEEASSRLAAIVESSEDAIIGKTLDGIITNWNKGAERMYGYTPEEAIGKPISIIAPPEKADDIPRILDSIKRGERVEHYETQRVTKDGKRLHVVISVSPIKDTKGKTIGAATITHDITYRVVAESELAQARSEAEHRAAELESFILSIEDGVLLFDSKGNIVFINEAGKGILGVQSNESFARWTKNYPLRTLSGKLLREEKWASRRALKGERIRDKRYMVINPQGKQVIISITASPVFNSHGQTVGATCVFRDVSKMVEFELQKEELYKREHHIADMLQQALVPPQPRCKVPACKLAFCYQAALDEAQVGGDFYDVFELGEDKVGILIGDVAGKGLLAAMRVASARYSIRDYSYIGLTPSKVLTLANESLCKDNSRDESSMLTLFYAVVDFMKKTVTYANAGHEPPILMRLNGRVETLAPTGPVIGILPGMTYSESTARLETGDRIAMVTDGITEARTQHNELFGIEGVVQSLMQNRSDSIEDTAVNLLQTASQYAGGSLQDDAAIVILEID